MVQVVRHKAEEQRLLPEEHQLVGVVLVLCEEVRLVVVVLGCGLHATNLRMGVGREVVLVLVESVLVLVLLGRQWGHRLAPLAVQALSHTGCTHLAE
jgi:hypothetical protein